MGTIQYAIGEPWIGQEFDGMDGTQNHVRGQKGHTYDPHGDRVRHEWEVLHEGVLCSVGKK